MTDQRSFSERLVWARAEAGLTQKQLADASKISAVQIARYEAGKSMPRLGAALKLARVLNVDAFDLVPELRQTSREINVEFSPIEAKFMADQAEALGISVEELIRKLTIFGLKGYLKDPETRAIIERDEPGLIAKVEALHEDD